MLYVISKPLVEHVPWASEFSVSDDQPNRTGELGSRGRQRRAQILAPLRLALDLIILSLSFLSCKMGIVTSPA